MAGHCPICLKDLKEPVAIPCGHVYCSACIGNHSMSSDKLKFTARCPLATCQQDFNLFIPDINALPKKFRSFVNQPMRRIHLSSWQTEEDLRKERDQYKQIAETLRLSKTNLEDRVLNSDRQAERYRRKADRMKREHAEEKKNFEARIQLLEARLSETEDRLRKKDEGEAANIDDSPVLGKRRRTMVENDENVNDDLDTIMAHVSHANSIAGPSAYLPNTPMSMDIKGKGVPRDSSDTVMNLQTPKPLRVKHNTTPNASIPNGYRFAFRAPSTSLLALRGPRAKRDYSITAPRF